MTVRTTLALLSIAIASAAAAQEQCSSRTITERWLQAHGRHIDLAQEADLLEQAGPRGGGVQTIPVVVHVVWNTTSENVSNTTIMNIIDQMNDDYQAMNADYDDVRATFANSRANAQIDFCLANLDPSGNATTGITRMQTTKTWFNPDTETDDMKFAPYGTAAWNPLKYLNIWICDISSGATGGFVTAGYAYLPYGGTVGLPIDGLVLDYTYGTGPGDRTATHEVGHYLGLDHPWGNGTCNPGDGIGDTPATNSPTFSCSNQNLMKCGTLTQYENFMDYSNCTMMFTNGQSTVMSGILNGMRSALLSSTACTGGGTTDPCIPTSTNGPSDNDFVDGVVLGSINNTGSGSSSGPTYVNYSSTFSTVLARSTSYSLQITAGDYSDDNFAAWIDYNGDHTFSAAEKLGEFNITAAGETQAINFTVPSNATLGTTAMRIRGVYHLSSEPSPTDPCYDYAYGETEDYGISITASSAINEMQEGGITVRNFPGHVLLSWPYRAKGGKGLVLDASGRIVEVFHVQGTQFMIRTDVLAPGIYQFILNLNGARSSSRFVVTAQ